MEEGRAGVGVVVVTAVGLENQLVDVFGEIVAWVDGLKDA